MLITSETIIAIITILGTAAFALAAVLAASEKQVDFFTITLLAVITAVGGGTLRDLILDVPVFWSQDTSYLWIAMVASVLGIAFFSLLKKKWVTIVYLYMDTIAVAMFAIQGTDKAWELGFGLPIAPVLMGIVTAIGGGVIRDVLLQRPSLLLSKELYAIPIAIGCTLHATVLAIAPVFNQLSAMLAISFIIYLRHLSISKHLIVPDWFCLNNKNLS